MAEKQFVPFDTVRFESPIWNMVPVHGKPILIIELRNDLTRNVSFSAFDFNSQKFLWRDMVLPEKWWVTLMGVTDDTVWMKVFDSADNPDKSSLVSISLANGKIVDSTDSFVSLPEETLRPAQYLDGEEEFEVVKNFLQKKLQVAPKLGAEYLAYENFIFISYYKGNPASFVNSFSVFTQQGKFVFEEEIGTNLKGIGWNTFFIVNDRVFFVKNKMELVTFRIV